jgi:hypothetical protein
MQTVSPGHTVIEAPRSTWLSPNHLAMRVALKTGSDPDFTSTPGFSAG